MEFNELLNAESTRDTWYDYDEHNKPIAFKTYDEYLERMLSFGESLESGRHIIKQTPLICKRTGQEGMISTVFLSINQALYYEKPVLWESMVFITGHPFNKCRLRATSHRQALKNHSVILRAFRNGHTSTVLKWGDL